MKRPPVEGLVHSIQARLKNEAQAKVFPPTEEIVPGGMLGLPMASVRAYTPYTTVAEKLEAMVLLGEANSRLKDYHDLALLPRMLVVDGATLVESIHRTFAHRATPIPSEPLEGLSDSFTLAPLNAGRWRAFREKSGLNTSAPDLREIATQIRPFAEPALQAARQGQAFAEVWPPGGPWQPAAGGRS